MNDTIFHRIFLTFTPLKINGCLHFRINILEFMFYTSDT